MEAISDYKIRKLPWKNEINLLRHWQYIKKNMSKSSFKSASDWQNAHDRHINYKICNIRELPWKCELNLLRGYKEKYAKFKAVSNLLQKFIYKIKGICGVK